MGATSPEILDRYLAQLSDQDLRLLADATADGDGDPGGAAARLRRHPELLEVALASPAAFAAMFPHHAPSGPGLAGEAESQRGGLVLGEALPSPFLLFAVAVHRAVADLAERPFAGERFAGFRRVPVFDADKLGAHFADPERRLFAIEHLASYTRVASGPLWVSRGRGRARRIRYSELDPVRLAGLLEVVEPEAQAGIYRRLGDLALFLSGVFPDHCARTAAHPIAVSRLTRSAQVSGAGAFELADVPSLTGADGLDGLMRVLGPRWYRLAARKTPLPALSRLLTSTAASFEEARRFLTVLTDRYLFPVRDQWFGRPA